MLVRKYISFFLCISILVFCWVLFGFNYWNGDRDAYEVYYARESLLSWGLEIGYGASNIIANKAGFNFQSFQLVLSFIILGMYYKFLKEFSVYPLLSLLLFVLIFFPLDYVLLRNFISFAFVIYGVLYLVKGGYGRAVYFIVVVIASLFHQSSLFFLPFAFLKLTRKYNFIEIFLYVFFLIIFAFILNRVFVLPSAVQNHFDIYPVSLASAVLKVVVHLFFSLSVCFFSSKFIRQCELVFIANKSWFLKQSYFIYNLNIISMLFIIFYFESEIFVRLLRYLLFLNLLYLLNSIFIARNLFLRLSSFFLMILISFFVVFYFVYPVMNYTVYPLFENNLVLEGRFL